MIIEKNTSTVQSSGDFKSSSSKIVADVHLKKILRSGIYTDKLLAVIRETISNAYDAHVQAGCADKPIQIKLPSLDDPSFKVKDEGVGLDDYGIREILFSYGDPTQGQNIKGKSNDFHGMYHIGAKAPWSYTTTFEVTAIKDGVKRIYMAYIDETEDDQIAQIGEEKTKEHNGIEIAVSIKNQDIDGFNRKVYDFLKFWNPRPIITGNDNYVERENKWVIKKEDWGFLEKPMYSYGHSQSYIVMNGVPYKISADSISDLEDFERQYLSSGLILFCKIGDVKLSSGREEVEYTEKTITFLRKSFADIKEEMKSSIEKAVSDVKNLFEAKKLYHELYNGSYSKFAFQLHYSNGFVFDGQSIQNSSLDFNQESLLQSEVKYYYQYKSKTRLSYGSVINTRISYGSVINFFEAGSKKYFFAIDEKARITASKIRHLLGPAYTSDDHYVLTFESIENKEAFFNKYGIPESLFVDIDTLPEPVKVKRQRTINVRRENVKIINDINKIGTECVTNLNAVKWASIDVNSQKGFYVTYHRDYFYIEEKPMTLYNIQAYANLINQPIFCLNQALFKSLKKHGGCLKEIKMKDVKRETIKYIKLYNKSILPNLLSNRVLPEIFSYVYLKLIKIPKNHIISKHIELYNKHQKQRGKDKISLIDYFSLDGMLKNPDDSFKNKLEKTMGQFGLLSDVKFDLGNCKSSNVIDYLCFKDKKIKKVKKELTEPQSNDKVGESVVDTEL